MLETEKLISEIDIDHIFQEASELCRVIKRDLGNLSSQARW